MYAIKIFNIFTKNPTECWHILAFLQKKKKKNKESIKKKILNKINFKAEIVYYNVFEDVI